MKRVIALILILAVVLLAGCQTVADIKSDWEVMEPEQVLLEKGLIVFTTVAMTTWFGYVGYLAFTMEPFPEELVP